MLFFQVEYFFLEQGPPSLWLSSRSFLNDGRESLLGFLSQLESLCFSAGARAHGIHSTPERYWEPLLLTYGFYFLIGFCVVEGSAM